MTVPRRIGVDLDNTLIDYTEVFAAAARERSLIDATVGASKSEVRDAIRRLPDGEISWQRLQGYVYGSGIGGARLFPGALEFLRACRAHSAPVFIVSHKTRFGNYDPARVDLREAALAWMSAHGLFRRDDGAIARENVFFADDRAAKLARIAALDCSCFIDDLDEVFADPGFPAGVTRILFGSGRMARVDFTCPTWPEITAAVFGGSG